MLPPLRSHRVSEVLVTNVLGKLKEIRTSERTSAHNILSAPDMTKLERRERERERGREREGEGERERERERERGGREGGGRVRE